MECPVELELMTGDECAECLPVSHEFSRVLWGFVNEASNPTPLGGDGSNGTVETPCGRLSKSNDDKVVNFWGRLTREQQMDLVEAAKKDGIIQ